MIEPIGISPQVQSAQLVIRLVLQIYISHYWYILPLQAELSKRDAQTADLQENVKSQQAEASKAKEELTNALASMERLKETFNKGRADWETEKASLTKKAEDVEAVLNRWLKNWPG
mgnify:CR=1 FL=1